jgi:glycosyltransferase involved in cell wall biosynthesis
MDESIAISVVVPVFNEQDSLTLLFEALHKEVKKLALSFEIIFIDDGSVDQSYEILKKLRQNHDQVKIIRFRKNFGKSVALYQGFKLAQGNIIFTIDGDLQDDPTEMENFIKLLDQGYDLVSGWKQFRKDPFISKRLPSRIFNKVVSIVSGLKLNDYNCGFKAYRKELAKKMPLYGGFHRFIPAIAYSMGYKVTEIRVAHHPRRFGRSKYGFFRIFSGLFDFLTITFITRYLKRPMHFFGWMGVLLLFSGSSICSYLTLLWFSGQAIGHRPLLNLGVLLIILSVQFFSTGLIAEMITHGYHGKPKQDPIDKILN